MEATPDPSPVEIREQCWRIQEGWTAKERIRRAPWWAEQQVVEFPQAWAVAWLETGGTAAD